MSEYSWWKKSGIHQMRLVVYPITFKVLYIQTLVVWDFWTINDVSLEKVLLGSANHHPSGGVTFGRRVCRGGHWPAQASDLFWKGLDSPLRPLKTTIPKFVPETGNGYISHRKGKGKSSTQNAIFEGYVSSLEGNTLPLQMVVSNRNLLFQGSIFGGELLVSGRLTARPPPQKKRPYKNQPQLWPTWKRIQHSCFATFFFAMKKLSKRARLVFRKGCRFAAVKGWIFVNPHSQDFHLNSKECVFFFSNFNHGNFIGAPPMPPP